MGLFDIWKKKKDNSHDKVFDITVSKPESQNKNEHEMYEQKIEGFIDFGDSLNNIDRHARIEQHSYWEGSRDIQTMAAFLFQNANTRISACIFPDRIPRGWYRRTFFHPRKYRRGSRYTAPVP